jgi:hypothetical protein
MAWDVKENFKVHITRLNWEIWILETKSDMMSDWVTHPGNSDIGMGTSPRVNSTCTWPHMCFLKNKNQQKKGLYWCALLLRVQENEGNK